MSQKQHVGSIFDPGSTNPRWIPETSSSGLPWDEVPEGVQPEIEKPNQESPSTLINSGFMASLPSQQADDGLLPNTEGWPLQCCLAGPCRHWTSIAQAVESAGTTESQLPYNYCRYLKENGGDSMRLENLPIRACRSFAPPLLSITGWRQRLVHAQLIGKTYEYYGASLPLAQRLLIELAKKLGYPERPGPRVAPNPKKGSVS